jgi:outer membrane protein TolC
MRSPTVSLLSATLLSLAIPSAASGQPLLTLDQAVRTALENNRSLAGARAGVASAAWEVRKARANWLPKVELNTGVTRIDGESLRFANAPIDFIQNALPPELKENIRPFAYRNTYSTGVSILQPIYNGGLERVGIETAGLLRQREEHALQDTEQEVVSRVKKAYYAVLKAQELTRLSRETERRTLSYLESTKRKAGAGLRTPADILRWEAQAASDRGNVVDAENALATTRAALNEGMGVDLDRDYTFEPPGTVLASAAPAPEPRPLKPAYDPASLRSHPGVLAAQSLIGLQRQNLRKAWGEFQPRLNFAFSYAWEKNATPALDGAKAWSAGLMLRFPVFNGFGDYAQVRQARADLRRAESLAQDVERQWGLRARTAALTVNSAQERIAIARKGIEYAEANLQTVTRRYEAGVASNIDLIDAQTTAYQARALLIHATYDAAIARAELERATGKTPSLIPNP